MKKLGDSTAQLDAKVGLVDQHIAVVGQLVHFFTRAGVRRVAQGQTFFKIQPET